MDYADMLKKAREEMPDVVSERERFEIPKVKGHLAGNKTVIINLRQVAETLRRPIDHLFKYLLKELAAPGTLGKTATFGAKVPASKVNEKIRKYAGELVFCSVCGKADTEFKREGNMVHIRCHACGASYPVKTKL